MRNIFELDKEIIIFLPLTGQGKNIIFPSHLAEQRPFHDDERSFSPVEAQSSFFFVFKKGVEMGSVG